MTLKEAKVKISLNQAVKNEWIALKTSTYPIDYEKLAMIIIRISVSLLNNNLIYAAQLPDNFKLLVECYI